MIRESFPQVKFGEVSDGLAALEALQRSKWDILLLDMRERSRLEVLKEAKRLHPELPIVALGAPAADDFAIWAFRFGASSYVRKDFVGTDLVNAMNAALRGQRFLSKTTCEILGFPRQNFPSCAQEILTDREHQVLTLLSHGKGYKEVAKELGLSESTIAKYRIRIMQKLNPDSSTRYKVRHNSVALDH